MAGIEVKTTNLSGVLILKPRRFLDDRGYFTEVWNARALAEAGISVDFVQDNQS
ncbi:MAG: dTDP-4-dehydrorhamnose 3,5-epimerase family protein, partial [Devosia sp.]